MQVLSYSKYLFLSCGAYAVMLFYFHEYVLFWIWSHGRLQHGIQVSFFHRVVRHVPRIVIVSLVASCTKAIGQMFFDSGKRKTLSLCKLIPNLHFSSPDAILHLQRASDQGNEIVRHQRSQGGSLDIKLRKTVISFIRRKGGEDRAKTLSAGRPPPSPLWRHLTSSHGNVCNEIQQQMKTRNQFLRLKKKARTPWRRKTRTNKETPM